MKIEENNILVAFSESREVFIYSNKGELISKFKLELNRRAINDRFFNKYLDKTVVVTGGAGCIGGNLCLKLSELNANKIIILDNLSSAYEWNIPLADNIHFINGDILDDEMLKRVFKEKPDYVFHLAAHFANQNSVDNPETDLMVNGMGILKVLEYSQICGGRILLAQADAYSFYFYYTSPITVLHLILHTLQDLA